MTDERASSNPDDTAIESGQDGSRSVTDEAEEADEDRSPGGGDGADGADGVDEDERPRYKIRFEGRGCIGTGRCAEVSSNWRMDVETGKARPVDYFFGEDDLDHNIEAARVCPAANGDGVIEVVDRVSGEVVEGSGSGEK